VAVSCSCAYLVSAVAYMHVFNLSSVLSSSVLCRP
jgi:hypothetical protein